MSDLPLPPGLADWMAGVERQLRDLATGNPLNNGSVQDASGNWVPVSGLAFGQVATIWSGTGVFDTAGVAGQAAATQSSWVYFQSQLAVEVLVRGGRLRVDWSALMALLGGNSGAVAAWAYSYAVDFMGGPTAKDSVQQRVINPDYYRALSVRDIGLAGTYVQAANWAMHTGLQPGWYRIYGATSLGYASTTGTQPHGFGDNPRLAATPF